jgi:hypothetical protein
LGDRRDNSRKQGCMEGHEDLPFIYEDVEVGSHEECGVLGSQEK